VNFLVRFLTGYAIVTALAVLLAMKLFSGQLVPGVRQSVEDMLVQTANLLAEAAASESAQGRLDAGKVEALFKSYRQRQFQARIYGVVKNEPDLRIYVTDTRGIVVFDSRGMDVGEDYSRWLDVSRTLKGEYGARTTQENPYDSSSTVMYVAAPIRINGQLAGALSVGKPARSFQTFIDLAKAETRKAALGLFALAMLISLAFSWWMTRDLRRLVIHANEAAEGKRATIPIEGRSELRRLAQAIEHLRKELDGKTHVEKVTQLLAHELKSPIAAVRGAAELLEEEDDPARRTRLEANIREETVRLQNIVEGVLNLARAENINQPPAPESFPANLLIEELQTARQSRLAEKSLRLEIESLTGIEIKADRFLLRQALLNLLDNAIDFSPAGAVIHCDIQQTRDNIEIRFRDHGNGIPDYARTRLFERFYSTPRPDGGQRGTGLGLNFVEQAARLHGGTIILNNHQEGGVVAVLSLPR
jgi:two-component system sensor histidine kinase CreC